MRFLIISIFLHTTGVIVLLLTGGEHRNSKRPSELLVVDFVAPAKVSVSSRPEPNLKKSSDQTSKKQLSSKKFVAKTPKSESNQFDEAVKDTSNTLKKLDYASELKLFLEKRKKYPRMARKLRQSGTAIIQVQISLDGSFSKVTLLESSHFKSLDQAAVKLVASVRRFKPLPKNYSTDQKFSIPISYLIVRGGVN